MMLSDLSGRNEESNGPTDLFSERRLPAQLAELLQRPAERTPERRLMAAVLADAIRSFCQCAGARETGSQRRCRETADWFESPDVRWPFSFENICDALALDPGWVRGLLRRWVVAQRTRIGAPPRDENRWSTRGVGGSFHRAGRYVRHALVLGLVLASMPSGGAYSMTSAVQPAEPTSAQLQQLVAPIALYPDELIAQVLAAATYPEQIVQADRWVQAHAALQAPQLAQQVDAQPWDPSVKAVAQFPSVLANMDKNLSWTSALGDAYVNQQQAVMDAIQVMRHRSRDAGKLRTTSQQNVVVQGSQLVIEPVNPEIVYVPQYDPWLVYGAPVVAWPGWYAYPGLFVAEPGIAFGVGFDIGFFSGFGWGWHHWGCDWGRRAVLRDHNVWVSNSRTFVNRRTFDRERSSFGHGGGFASPHGDVRGGGALRDGGRVGGEPHAFAAPRGVPEGRWGAFSGFDHGGATRGLSERGSSSFGELHDGGVHGGDFGGGGFHGGGFGGGGFHGGGHR